MKIRIAAVILGIIFLVVFVVALFSCNGTKTVKTTPSIDRTVIGTVQTIDSYPDYSILHFDNNISIEVANASLNNYKVQAFFGQLATYQLQGLGMYFDDGYHEYNLINFQVGQVIIGGKSWIIKNK